MLTSAAGASSRGYAPRLMAVSAVLVVGMLCARSALSRPHLAAAETAGLATTQSPTEFETDSALSSPLEGSSSSPSLLTVKDPEADGRTNQTDTDTVLTIEFEDCSADDGEEPQGVYAGKVVGLRVRYTHSGAPVPRRNGKQTLPLGVNLTIDIISERPIPTPPGTHFAVNSFGFPFWVHGDACLSRTVILPLNLGGVYFAGAPCPLPAGTDVASASIKLPPVLPLGQLSFLQMREVWAQVQQILPNGNKMTCAFIHVMLEGTEGEEAPSFFSAFG